MSDEENEEISETLDNEDMLEEEPKKGKKGLLFVVVGVLALLGIGAGLHFSGMLGGGKAPAEPVETAQEAASKVPPKTVFYELPQFLINLNSGTDRVSFLKITVTLELRDEKAAIVIDENKPRIMDAFNTYLRELRPSDLAGSAGIYRLREELLTRLNNTVESDLVVDILFSEILVQ
jgi:flagellar FliL protein